jgi:hypothetical protein
MAKSTSQDWARTSALAGFSVKSALRAGGVDVLSVLVVGNDKPETITFDGRCSWLQADLQVPGDATISEKMADKGTKLQMGFMHTFRRAQADWVMFMDADDFISNRLLRVADLRNWDAVCLTRGYRWNVTSGLAEIAGGFHLQCGTSWLMRLTEANFPAWLSNKFDSRVCDQSHADRLRALERSAAKVQMVREPLVVYVVGSNVNSYAGRSLSKKACRERMRDLLVAIRSRILGRRVNDSLRREFSLPERQALLI